MSAELSEEESLLLPYMKNDMYQKCYSVIVRHFPITSIVGLRLVDVGLLTISEHKELHSMPRATAGISLLSTLEAKGDDSMASFYRVLVNARDEKDVAVILRHLEEEAQRRRMTSKDSGVSCDFKSPTSSTSSLPEDSLPHTSSFTSRNVHFKVDLAITHIKEMREEINDSMEERETQTRMLQQVFGAVNNVEAQLYHIMQYLPPSGQWPFASEVDSLSSVYQTCPNSRRDSEQESRQQGSELMAPEAARFRRQSLPPTLPSSTNTNHRDRLAQAAATLRDKFAMERIAEEPMDLSTQHGAAVSPGTETGNTKNPAELDSLSVESVKMSDPPTPDQTLRRRRPASVNPFKAILRKFSRTDPV